MASLGLSELTYISKASPLVSMVAKEAMQFCDWYTICKPPNLIGAYMLQMGFFVNTVHPIVPWKDLPEILYYSVKAAFRRIAIMEKIEERFFITENVISF